MMRISFLLLMALAVAVGLVSGCYTVIRHPATDLTGEDPAGKNCQDCHADADYYHWTDPYYTAFYPYDTDLGWTYYGHPWWYQDYWYRVPGSPGGTPVEVNGRHAWDRGPGAPVYVPSVGGTHVTPATTPEPRGTTTPTPQDTTRNAKPDRSKEEPKRHGWGR